jgi:hypothetical protein
MQHPAFEDPYYFQKNEKDLQMQQYLKKAGQEPAF